MSLDIIEIVEVGDVESESETDDQTNSTDVYNAINAQRSILNNLQNEFAYDNSSAGRALRMRIRLRKKVIDKMQSGNFTVFE